MVEDGVNVRNDTVLLGDWSRHRHQKSVDKIHEPRRTLDRLDELLLGSPVGALVALLVELSKVVQVVLRPLIRQPPQKPLETVRLTMSYPVPSVEEPLVGGGSHAAVMPISPSRFDSVSNFFQWTPPPSAYLR